MLQSIIYNVLVEKVIHLYNNVWSTIFKFGFILSGMKILLKLLLFSFPVQKGYTVLQGMYQALHRLVDFPFIFSNFCIVQAFHRSVFVFLCASDLQKGAVSCLIILIWTVSCKNLKHIHVTQRSESTRRPFLNLEWTLLYQTPFRLVAVSFCSCIRYYWG